MPRVLLVDDDPAWRRLYRMALESHFELFEATLQQAWNGGRPEPFKAFENIGRALLPSGHAVAVVQEQDQRPSRRSSRPPQTTAARA